jgi:K+-sensing histidine kinase KdpD
MQKEGLKKQYSVGLLIGISMLLLVAFLSQWLYIEYKSEKAGLEKDLSQLLVKTKDALIDSAIRREFVLPALIDETNKKPFQVKIISQIDTFRSNDKKNTEKIISHRILRKRKNVSIAGITIRDSLFQNEESVIPQLDKLTKGIKILVHEMNTESSHAVIDRKTLKTKFDTNLDKQGYNLRTGFPLKDDAGQFVIKTDNRTESIRIMGFNNLLLSRILPEILFALLLVSITSTAFYTMHRNIRTQQRLSLMKDDLVSNMTHELKTPISTVKVALEALDNFNMIEDRKKTREYLDMAISEMTRLEMLVEQTLNISFLETGTIMIKKERHDLKRVIEETLSAMHLKIEQAGAHVHFEHEEDDLFAQIDKLHFQGAIINLLDNSIKYGGKAVRIDMTLKQDGNDILFTLQDNGPGIPAKFRDRVFEKFFRVPTGNVHDSRGYGLGLSYVKQVIEQHEGTIILNENDLGGSSFIIKLRKA